MNESTIKAIQKLTKSDTKTLSQKALKLCEETGEVAREILPFENAHATTHRFGTKERILEECADVFLTDISIAFELGFTWNDFTNMVGRKMIKWAELQQRHDQAEFPVPFEIHISVKNANLEEFRQVCHALDVKPIILALQVGEEELQDVMTSSHHFGDNSSAYEEMKRVSEGLDRAGFQVVREKIETVPWHPGAPSEKHEDPVMPKDCYFETHIGVFIRDEYSCPNGVIHRYQVPSVKRIADDHKAHLSRNAFKKVDNGPNNSGHIQMVTLRHYEGTYEHFKEKAEELRSAIENNNFLIDNMITEFSVYDTRVTHDLEWIGAQ